MLCLAPNITPPEKVDTMRLWIDTTTGTWGEVEHSNGKLVILDASLDEARQLDDMSDSEIADFGLAKGSVPWTQLTPDLALLAINHGVLDDHLDMLLDAIRSRREIASSRKATSLKPGDEFFIVNISPKMLTGERVKFLQHDGQWLQCEFVGHPPGKYRQGDKVKLRHSHVGAII